jgi:YggT family protein
MRAVLDVVLIALDAYTWVVIAAVVMSWLVGFSVVNIRNDVVRTIWNMLGQLTEPLLAPIRRRLPFLGGIDLSPVVLILGIILVGQIIRHYIYPNVF